MDEKSFITLAPSVNVVKRFWSSLLKKQNKLDHFPDKLFQTSLILTGARSTLKMLHSVMLQHESKISD
jgi:hypothetical protein